MTEDEKEELVHELCNEFAESVGLIFNDVRKYAFIAGARSAIVALQDRGLLSRADR